MFDVEERQGLWFKRLNRWGRQLLLALAGTCGITDITLGPAGDRIEDRREAGAGFGQRVAGARRHRRVDRLRQHASTLELSNALGKRGGIDGASPTSHLIEAEWMFQQGLNDQQIPLLLKQQDGRDEAWAGTAFARILI